MPWTVLGWLLIASSIAIWALLICSLQSNGARRERPDAARPALLSRLLPPSSSFGQELRGPAGPSTVAAAVFLLVACIGAAASYLGGPRDEASPGETSRFTQSRSASDGELARLTDYTRSIGPEETAPIAAGDNLLPDVNTMIERLAARLEATPEDIKGWRMLGWSYFHTARYEEAATAFARAVELDPSSAELKRSYEEAKAKASESDGSEKASASQTGAVGKGGDEPSVEKATTSEVAPPPEHGAQIRSMVDGLAARLESSPRDVEGWTRLMRSRVVLGEREVAATAFRQALEVFKDDAAASGKITAAATELGLNGE